MPSGMQIEDAIQQRVVFVGRFHLLQRRHIIRAWAAIHEEKVQRLWFARSPSGNGSAAAAAAKSRLLQNQDIGRKPMLLPDGISDRLRQLRQISFGFERPHCRSGYRF